MVRPPPTSRAGAPVDPDEVDVGLLRRTAAGDRRAFDELVRRRAPALLRFARGLTHDPVLAEDVLQQTFLSVFRSASSFRGEATVRSWLLTITRNTALRLRAQRGREEPVEKPLERLGADAGWGTPDPEAIALVAERRDLLQRALAALSASDREVLILRDIEQLSGPETAKLLGVQVRAMKSRLHRARLRLGAALRALGDKDGD